MKIEIDLNEILQDEYGPTENLAESIRRQIIDSIAGEVKKGIQTRITEETQRVINEELQVQVRDRMPEIVDDILTAPYTIVGLYGQKGETTNFRDELIKAIHSQMKYAKTAYASDANAFTKAVDAIVAENMKKFQTEFNFLVKDTFTRDALNYATTEMRKRLGLDK
jgi:hypothetical protein